MAMAVMSAGSSKIVSDKDGKGAMVLVLDQPTGDNFEIPLHHSPRNSLEAVQVAEC